MDYKEFFVDLDIIGLKVFFDNQKNKIIRSEIIEKKSKNIKEEKNNITDLVKKCFFGNIDKFDISILNFDRFNKFQKDVLTKLTEIPRGKVTTYKKLAEKVGKNNAYRAIGTVLARNPFPIILPCHRVIKSNFHIGYFGDRMDLKIKILQFEGIMFKKEFFILEEFVL